MQKILTVIGICAAITLSGCGQKEPVKTVEWFKAHKEERLAQIDACQNNPGEMSATPNCINAESAQSSVIFSSTKGINVKPVSAEEFRKVFFKH